MFSPRNCCVPGFLSAASCQALGERQVPLLLLEKGTKLRDRGSTVVTMGMGTELGERCAFRVRPRRSRRFTEVSEKCDTAAVTGTPCTEATWQAKERRGTWEFPGCLSPRPREWAVSEDSGVETLGCTRTFRTALPVRLLTLLDGQPCEVRATSSPREYCYLPLTARETALGGQSW